MNKSTQMAAKAGVSVAAAGAAASMLGWVIAGPILVACAGAALWAFWPGVERTRGGGRIPLEDAALRLCEAAGSKPPSDAHDPADAASVDELQRCMRMLLTSGIPVFGRKSRAGKVVPIPQAELEALFPRAGRNVLADETGKNVSYSDVRVSAHALDLLLREVAGSSK